MLLHVQLLKSTSCGATRLRACSTNSIAIAERGREEVCSQSTQLIGAHWRSVQLRTNQNEPLLAQTGRVESSTSKNWTSRDATIYIMKRRNLYDAVVHYGSYVEI